MIEGEFKCRHVIQMRQIESNKHVISIFFSPLMEIYNYFYNKNMTQKPLSLAFYPS